ncbi:MAG TPA: hypothetical protein VGR52_10925 [Stellaceae bacterium]|nr:hypothetical protein [Stellaceae bacterium]
MRRIGILKRPWVLSFLALIPIIWAYATHFIGVHPGYIATGFLQYDQASYMADARQYADGPFHFLYGLPFSPNYDTPRIYFQPQIFFLGVILRITGLDPGLLYVAFGLVAALGFFRIAIALYTAVVGLETPGQKIMLPAFLWGGGVVVLLSAYLLSVYHKPISSAHIFWLERTNGYWMMNLGRNAFYSVEAYYHALFLGAVLMIVRKYYLAALVLIAALSASHPFTGFELALIATVWTLAESIYWRHTAPPVWFSACTVAVLLLHVGYYLILLKWLSPEYVAVESQWNLDWKLEWYNIVAAFSPVFAAVVWRLRNRRRIVDAFSDRTFRILFGWFAVSITLAKHDLFITPRQPLHFTHGYIWASLFLMGAPTMTKVADRLLMRSGLLGLATALILLGFMLTDNIVWFGRFGAYELSGKDFADSPLVMTTNEADVLHRLNESHLNGSLVLSDSNSLAYLTTVYTPLRCWYSHIHSTPYALERESQTKAFFSNGTEVEGWRSRPTIVVHAKAVGSEHGTLFRRLGYYLIYQNASFQVFYAPRRALISAGTSGRTSTTATVPTRK